MIKRSWLFGFVSVVGALVSASPAIAAESLKDPEDCIAVAAAHHKVSAHILRAIAWQESRMRGDAIGRNRNGTIDYGAFQINSIHLQRLKAHGVDVQTLMTPCMAAYVGAWILREQMNAYGNTWRAVGAYHSRTPALNLRYAKGVAGVLRKWGFQVDGP